MRGSGVLYEFIVVSVFYWAVAACIAELASAIPSSAGVYQYASVTPGPKYGRVVGFFAGWWNYLAWVFGAASMTLIFVCGTCLYRYQHLLTMSSPTQWFKCKPLKAQFNSKVH